MKQILLVIIVIFGLFEILIVEEIWIVLLIFLDMGRLVILVMIDDYGFYIFIIDIGIS